MRRRSAWVWGCWLALVTPVLAAQDNCDHRLFGAVEKRGMESPSDADDRQFPVDDHAAAPRPRRGLSETSWGWGCTTTLIVDLDKVRASRINRCSPGSSDYDFLWARYAKRASLVTHRVLKNGYEQWEAVETRTLDKDQVAAFTCLANELWSQPSRPLQSGPPVPPHSVGYMRLWDGESVKFIGGYVPFDPKTEALSALVYRWFQP